MQNSFNSIDLEKPNVKIREAPDNVTLDNGQIIRTSNVSNRATKLFIKSFTQLYDEMIARKIQERKSCCIKTKNKKFKNENFHTTKRPDTKEPKPLQLTIGSSVKLDDLLHKNEPSKPKKYYIQYQKYQNNGTQTVQFLQDRQLQVDIFDAGITVEMLDNRNRRDLIKMIMGYAYLLQKFYKSEDHDREKSVQVPDDLNLTSQDLITTITDYVNLFKTGPKFLRNAINYFTNKGSK